MSAGLPLEVLGLVAPILCWVEGAEKQGLTDTFFGNRTLTENRELAWFMRELPACGSDDYEDIKQLARHERRAQALPKRDKYRRRFKLAPPSGYDLADVLGRLGRHYFQWVGTELCVREGRMAEIHELAFRFPVAHIIQGCHAEAVAHGLLSEHHVRGLKTNLGSLPTTVQGFRNVIERGLTETHIHLNGVISAHETWPNYLLGGQNSPNVYLLNRDKLKVLSCMVLRMLAMGVLWARAHPMTLEEERTFERGMWRFFNVYDDLAQMRFLCPSPAFRHRLAGIFQEQALLIDKALKHVRETHNAEDISLLTPFFHPGMEGLSRRGRCYSYLGLNDQLQLVSRLHFAVQRTLLSEGPWPGRDFLQVVFFRYLIYHCHYWQTVTQHGDVKGLSHFQRFFDKRERSPKVMNSREVQGAVMKVFADIQPLRGVEGRLSPPRRSNDLKPWLVGFAHYAQKHRLDRFGVVVHFKKTGRDDDPRGRHKHTPFLRHGSIRRATKQNAMRLYRLLTGNSPSATFVIGIDAAGLELGAPPEVFAPAFRFLRDFPIEPDERRANHQRLFYGSGPAKLARSRRLGLTYHVGEDFRHLFSGLLAIEEAIRFLNPLPGDRLGHAIALAVDPRAWASQIGYQAVVTKQQWLDTLVWLYHQLGHDHLFIRKLDIEDRIQHLACDIYDSGCPGDDPDFYAPSNLYDAWLLRQLDPYCTELQQTNTRGTRPRRHRFQGTDAHRWDFVQDEVLAKLKDNINSQVASRLLERYWYHPATYEQGRVAIPIDMQPQRGLWIDTLLQVQQEMLDLVIDKELVIEINPSSNRLIGHFASYADHPIFRIVNEKDGRLASRVPLTVSTDDPGVFCTSITHEYYILGEILINAGFCEPDVVTWLESLRRNSHDYSFLRCLPGLDDEHMSDLLDKLRSNNRNLLHLMKGEVLQPIAFHPKEQRGAHFDRDVEKSLRRLLSDPDIVARLLRDGKLPTTAS
ncbi:MAG: hypothetical protein QNK37_26955 [Acidobacteriota bacterium]|nr:hypothetical protein [Acidobacteriota bacterium]